MTDTSNDWTHFDGVDTLKFAIGGVQIFPDDLGAAPGMPVSTPWFVDGVNGSDGNSGQSWDQALKTITAAVAACSAGDTIAIKGTAFNEAVVCNKAGVRFLGIGTGPAQATWTAPTVAGSFCLELAAGYCQVENIKFRPVIYTTSGIPTGILLSGAPYTVIRGCRFQGQPGSYTAIYSPVCNSDNVHIEGCEFLYFNTALHGQAILGVDAGGLSYSGWHVEGCSFNSCVYDIVLPARCGVFAGNSHPIGGIDSTGALGAITTQAVNLSGTNSGGNVVTGCALGGAYTSSLYVGGSAQDSWAGNFAAITATYCPNGVTVPTKPA